MKAISASCLLALVALMACSSSCRHHPTVRVPYDTAAARERLYSSTVRLAVQCIDGSGGWGSGVAVSTRHVLTARHVIDGCGEAGPWIITASPYGRPLTVEMVVDKIARGGRGDTEPLSRLCCSWDGSRIRWQPRLRLCF